MSSVKVSVIIPTYNRADMLVEAIESILSQTYQDFEIIISDDGSTDGTAEAILQFGDKIRYRYNENSGLPAVARNAGLKVARGEHVAFLDSDDLWLPDKLSKQIRILESDPGVGLVCSNAYVINHKGERKQKLYQTPGQGKRGDVFIDLLKSNFIITSTCLIRRDALEQVGGFSESDLLQVGEDYDLWLRIARTWIVEYIEDPLVYYLDTPAASVRGYQDMAQYWQGMIYILDGYRKTRFDLETRQALNLQKGLHRKDLMILYWKKKKYRLFVCQLAKLILLQPFFFVRWIAFETRQSLAQNP